MLLALHNNSAPLKGNIIYHLTLRKLIEDVAIDKIDIIDKIDTLHLTSFAQTCQILEDAQTHPRRDVYMSYR